MFRLSLITLLAGAIVPGPLVRAQSDEASNPYLDYSCQALIDAAKDVTTRAAQQLAKHGDAGVRGVSARGGETIVHWPDAFLAKMSGPKATLLSQLKARLVSIEQASIQAQCEIQFDGTRPPGA